jgi:hypothetical protein
VSAISIGPAQKKSLQQQVLGGTLKAASAPYRVDPYLVALAAGARGWITALGAAGAIAIAYILVARLGLFLIFASSDLGGVLAGARRRRHLDRIRPACTQAVEIDVAGGTVAANCVSNSSLVTCLLNVVLTGRNNMIAQHDFFCLWPGVVRLCAPFRTIGMRR